jgi:uncharacterized membrane protein
MFMDSSVVRSLSIGVFRKATARETAALLLVAGLLPFLIHLLPWSGARPLGAHLLPMFWTTFVAAYFYGPKSGVLVGLFAPMLNLVITGLPAWKFLGLISVELTVYALVAAWAVRRLPRFVLIAPLGYLVARLAVTTLQIALGVLGDAVAPLAYLAQVVVSSLAGLIVLTAINGALVRFYPKRVGDSNDAAHV